MASKRRNMFHKNKKQETTEIVAEDNNFRRLLLIASSNMCSVRVGQWKRWDCRIFNAAIFSDAVCAAVHVSTSLFTAVSDTGHDPNSTSEDGDYPKPVRINKLKARKTLCIVAFVVRSTVTTGNRYTHSEKHFTPDNKNIRVGPVKEGTMVCLSCALIAACTVLGYLVIFACQMWMPALRVTWKNKEAVAATPEENQEAEEETKDYSDMDRILQDLEEEEKRYAEMAADLGETTEDVGEPVPAVG
ncbi:hypothetical protein AAG570_005884 [Ranatra chinensis]|uniref:Uncharacterized protein n=1 Tax=Ranatra chinensis TaxID=642074 RepID=A0ABD0YEW8_9HEMI